jgi:HEAT repeat protein
MLRATRTKWLPAILRSSAAVGLGGSGHPAAEGRLLEILEEGTPRLHQSAILGLTLGAQRTDRPIEPIIQALRRGRGLPVPEPYQPPDAREIRDLGIEWWRERLPVDQLFSDALGSSDDPDLRIHAAEVLSLSPDDAVRESLERAASADSDEHVRAAARDALARLSKPVRSSR